MKLVLFLLTSVTIVFADKLPEQKYKFENKVIERITIKDDYSSYTLDFKILCLEDYKWLYRVGSSNNPIQMFIKDKRSKQTVPISCNGFEDSDDLNEIK